MKKKITFEKELIISALTITLIPLILSYTILLYSKLDDMDDRIRQNLKEMGNIISQNSFIGEKLYNKENDNSIQQYTKGFINVFNDIDIIVVADINGEKYSHLDESQIGEIFRGKDKQDVLAQGTRYYSNMIGSMGKTLRWFEPIYYNGEQVGFVMVGKYYKDIELMSSKITSTYILQFIFSLTIAAIISRMLSKKVKKAMLDMEPYDIARLYNEKNIIIDSVKDGIIALNKDNEVTEINEICYRLLDDFDIDKVLSRLELYIDSHEEIEMKEFIIQGKKIFVTIKTMMQDKTYLGLVITLIDKDNINKIAKEITGVDEVIKNLRANVHEFKNNLYVILGLLQLEKYEEAKKYILKVKHMQENNFKKFSSIDDYYIRALLLSRELVAREKKIDFTLTEESFLFETHNLIESNDIVTILGNLIENAFEACASMDVKEKRVEVSLFEDNDVIEIQVKDNGKKIDSYIKDKIFIEGVSSKGNNRGTGLFLVKNRVELHNGNIEIEEFKDEKIFVVTISKGEEL